MLSCYFTFLKFVLTVHGLEFSRGLNVYPLLFTLQWIPELQHYAPGVPVVLAGTKLERKIRNAKLETMKTQDWKRKNYIVV